MASLDTAIRLVTQAVNQDASKNYEEAARCYREALITFKQVANSDRVGRKVKKAIEEKCLLYENRLRKLDRHLLSKADLTNLFKECVNFELKRQNPELKNIKEEEDTSASVDSVELYENPFLKKGLDTIEKAKKEDSFCHLPEALHFYEQGAGLLLDAVRKNRVPERQADCIRIKCLLLHERCELIRNHLEKGAPLKVRKESLGSFENSLEGSPSNAGSPIPMFEEDKIMLMEEVRSVKSVSTHSLISSSYTSKAPKGSTHSLYPTCVEIKRSESVMSGHSDFGTTANTTSTPNLATKEELVPMLAQMEAELALSEVSLQSNGSKHRISPNKSINRQVSVEDILLLQKSSSMGSLGKDFSDSLLVLDKNGKVSCLSLDQRDRNLSELTYINSEIDPELYNKSVDNQSNSGSDSGFSDPINGLDSSRNGSKTPNSSSSSPAAAISTRKSSPDSDIDSIDIVPSLPPVQISPSLDYFQQQEDNKKPSNSPTPSSTSSSRRSRKSGSSVRMAPSEELVTVLSEETVVDGRAVKPEVYTRALETKNRSRPEYVPPRAMARQEDDGDDINKGCYYFMACLDSFWIL